MLLCYSGANSVVLEVGKWLDGFGVMWMCLEGRRRVGCWSCRMAR